MGPATEMMPVIIMNFVTFIFSIWEPFVPKAYFIMKKINFVMNTFVCIYTYITQISLSSFHSYFLLSCNIRCTNFISVLLISHHSI